MDMNRCESDLPSFRALTEDEVSSITGAGGPNSATISTAGGPVTISVTPTLSGVIPNGGTITIQMSTPNVNSPIVQSSTTNYDQAAADLNVINNLTSGQHTQTTDQEIDQAVHDIMTKMSEQAQAAAHQDFDLPQSSLFTSSSSSSSSSGSGRSGY